MDFYKRSKYRRRAHARACSFFFVVVERYGVYIERYTFLDTVSKTPLSTCMPTTLHQSLVAPCIADTFHTRWQKNGCIEVNGTVREHSASLAISFNIEHVRSARGQTKCINSAPTSHEEADNDQ